ncbi:TIM barrel protein [Amycolatopsis acidicola]|uniref:C-deglycosylation enzyme beta subunit n=1 Tax=Amycolatopsis acidicola TaxID=2596893 RepID=A0A5N0V2N0_9PSEU|nr:DUF6379 domain-containing protein [Amycolatopsis acidicola]KAA9160689.1 TIM barrel protein [Amycolatopsis acidicola]
MIPINEKYLLETQGLRNVTADGKVIGFEVRIRIGYYRGVSLAIVSDLELAVDGEAFRDGQLLFGVGGRQYTMSEMAAEESARWEFDEPALLTVLKPGGLTPGAHEITIRQAILPSYMPGNGFVSVATRTMTLCQDRPTGSAIGLGVSLYSYQEEYFTGAMSLEDCVAEVAAIGARGVQLLPEQMMPGYPDPPASWVDAWHALMERHGTRPTVMDTFVDVSLGGHRVMRRDEAVDHLVIQMKLAKRLGFTMIRPTTGPVADAAPELIAASLPFAEELGILVAPEIHAPVRLDGPLVTSYLELIAASGTKHLGFTLDLGVFCTRMPPAMLGLARRQGVEPELVEFVARAFEQGQAPEEIAERVQEKGGGEAARALAMRTAAFGPPSNKPEALANVVPHVMNVHAKFYEVTREGVEESVPYGPVIDALVAGGYTGSLDSEYEGQRLTQDAFDTDSCEQVRRHHLLMRDSLRRAVGTP